MFRPRGLPRARLEPHLLCLSPVQLTGSISVPQLISDQFLLFQEENCNIAGGFWYWAIYAVSRLLDSPSSSRVERGYRTGPIQYFCIHGYQLVATQSSGNYKTVRRVSMEILQGHGLDSNLTGNGQFNKSII